MSVPNSATLSIIIPVLNERSNIVKHLQCLQMFRTAGHEIIVVDGGSKDNTPRLARPFADIVFTSVGGRALQMNAGAHVAQGHILLFLHADTQLPANADQLIVQALKQRLWGRFNVRLSGQAWLLRMVETFMNGRSCWTGIATGDQGIFVRQEVFKHVGGFPEIALMEDIELSVRLNKLDHPACIVKPVITSSRRWEQQGIIKTILLMWRLRWMHYRGFSAARLKREYEEIR